MAEDRPTGRNEHLLALGRRIRALRQAKELSQEELALRAGNGWTTSSVSRVETGSREVGVGRLWPLAKALDVPVSALFVDL